MTHVLNSPLAFGTGDNGVIDMDLLSVIRRWHFREGKPIREIERRTGLSRNTIRKYLRAGTVEPTFKVPVRPSKLDRYAEKLSGWLRVEAGKSRKQRRTVKQMHADLVALGFDGSYGRVAAFARQWRTDRQYEQQTSGRGTFVPLVFAPGEASSSTGARTGRSWAVSAPGCRSRIPSCRTAGRLSCALICSRPTRCCSMR